MPKRLYNGHIPVIAVNKATIANMIKITFPAGPTDVANARTSRIIPKIIRIILSVGPTVFFMTPSFWIETAR